MIESENIKSLGRIPELYSADLSPITAWIYEDNDHNVYLDRQLAGPEYAGETIGL
jgi:hypothetical protein